MPCVNVRVVKASIKAGMSFCEQQKYTKKEGYKCKIGMKVVAREKQKMSMKLNCTFFRSKDDPF